jgi:hypothetical protein
LTTGGGWAAAVLTAIQATRKALVLRMSVT